MPKILLFICSILFFSSFVFAAEPTIDGNVHIRYKCLPNETFVLPDEFKTANHVYVETQLGKDDSLHFYIDNREFKSYKINQLSGENTEGVKVIEFKHNLDYIHLVWEDILGRHNFDTIEIKYNPSLNIGMIFKYLLGNRLSFELELERI